MAENQNKVTRWIKDHKKEVIVAGVSVAALATVIVGVKHKETIMQLFEKVQRNSLPEMPSVKIEAPKESPTHLAESMRVPKLPLQEIQMLHPIEVSKHIRNLPEGWHPSAEKINTAAENGYQLLPNQTWVEAYTKRGMAA